MKRKFVYDFNFFSLAHYFNFWASKDLKLDPVLHSPNFRVWDPHPFHADPDPWFEIFANPDPGFKIFADPDPGLVFSPKFCVFFTSTKFLKRTLDPDQNLDPDPDPCTQNADPDTWT